MAGVAVIGSLITTSAVTPHVQGDQPNVRLRLHSCTPLAAASSRDMTSMQSTLLTTLLIYGAAAHYCFCSCGSTIGRTANSAASRKARAIQLSWMAELAEAHKLSLLVRWHAPPSRSAVRLAL